MLSNIKALFLCSTLQQHIAKYIKYHLSVNYIIFNIPFNTKLDHFPIHNQYKSLK